MHPHQWFNLERKLWKSSRPTLCSCSHCYPSARETLAKPGHSLNDGPVIAGRDWGDGRQAAWLHGLQADDSQEADQAGEVFSEMEVVVPWHTLFDLIEPPHPKASKKGGRPPYPDRARHLPSNDPAAGFR